MNRHNGDGYMSEKQVIWCTKGAILEQHWAEQTNTTVK